MYIFIGRFRKFYEGYSVHEDFEAKQAYDRKHDSDSVISFGGKTLWGVYLDNLCKRYGWTLDYVVWGISWVNLNMMWIDGIEARFPGLDENDSYTDAHECINGDNPDNRNKIRQIMFS